MSAVNSQPVVVAIDASDKSFKEYTGGLYKGPCGHSLDHEMLLVGYGTTSDNLGFWILKNSHGEGWGEKGYMRLLQDGVDVGACGILMDANYPTLDM